MSVELERAYVWDCPHCGQENFQRQVSAQLEPDVAHELAVAAGVIEEWQSMEEVGCSLLTYPDVVYCKRCEKQFSTTFSMSEDGPIEEDDDEDDDL